VLTRRRQGDANRTHEVPVPDELELEEQPSPQPERRQPKLADPAPRDLSQRDWIAIFKRAGKEMVDDNMLLIASAPLPGSVLTGSWVGLPGDPGGA